VQRPQRKTLSTTDHTADPAVVNTPVPPLPKPADRACCLICDNAIAGQRPSMRGSNGNQTSKVVKTLDGQHAGKNDDAPLARFAACVFEPDDIVELRLLPSKKSTWSKAADLTAEVPRLNIANRNGQNIYAGANPRTHHGGTKATDVLLARCLFADFDDTTAADEVRRRSQAAGLPGPTLLVDSGHGIHAWWRLSEPVSDMAEWSALQKALSRKLGSDKAIHDAPRIMRLPGFQNCKNDPPVPCRIITADFARRYPLEQYRTILTPAPEVGRLPSETKVHDASGIADDGISDQAPRSQRLGEGREAQGDRPEEASTICLAAVRQMTVADRKDGSHRLFAAACRAVEHDLDDPTALSVIRAYEAEWPFPREWTDQEILQRIRDAEKKCTRGEALLGDRHRLTVVGGDDRPLIPITTDEHGTNDAALEALTKDPDIFQRGGALVHIVRSGRRLGGISRPADSPVIAALPAAVLRERLTRAGRFAVEVLTKEGHVETVDAHPPSWCVKALHARATYPQIRPLEGIVESPILRPNGTILEQPGYDEATGLLYLPVGDPPIIKANPSRDDALAALLTVVGRHAIDGPVPLFLFDANVRGSGKTLQAETISFIATGRKVPRTPNPRNNEEVRKMILALALSGDSLILIDNVAGQLGTAALDAALTATVWKDRILKESRIVTAPLVVTWLASGNNVILGANTCRRVCHCRLDCKYENPEEREGFKYPDLAAHVRTHRGELLGAALTVLRAYFVAGRPQTKLRPWGSYEAWSALIRQCLVWLGLPDPGETREELRATADQEGRVLAALLSALHEADPHGQGMTTAQIIAAMDRPACPSLRDAVHELCDTTPGKSPSTRSLGNKLAHLRGRVVGGRALETRPGPAGFATWRVVSTAGSTGCSEVGGDAAGNDWGEV